MRTSSLRNSVSFINLFFQSPLLSIRLTAPRSVINLVTSSMLKNQNSCHRDHRAHRDDRRHDIGLWFSLWSLWL